MAPPEIDPGHTPCSVVIWVMLWLAATAILVKLGPQVVNPNRLHSLKTKDRHTRTWYPKTKPTKPHKEVKVCGSRAWVSCLSAPHQVATQQADVYQQLPSLGVVDRLPDAVDVHAAGSRCQP